MAGANANGPLLHPTHDRVILHGVTWATFEHLRADDQGSVERTTPSVEHETVKQFLILIVDVIAFARELHVLNVGPTTSTRADLVRGFEPDA